MGTKAARRCADGGAEWSGNRERQLKIARAEFGKSWILEVHDSRKVDSNSGIR